MSEAYFIFEITTRCNLDCIYCYNVWKQNDACPQKDLTLAEVKTIIANISKSVSFRGVTLAGGEPLLNKEIYQIASFLKSEGIKTVVTSNGILLNEDNIRYLIDCGVGHFEVSMPSVDNIIYEKLCHSDVMKKVRAAIINIKKYDVKLTVSSVITKYNLNDVYDIIELSAVFGADYFAFNRFVSGGRGLEFKNELSLNHEQLMQALGEANRAAKVFNFPVVVAIPVEHCVVDTSLFKNLNFGTCVCGDYKWVIGPDGNLRTCEQNPTVIGCLFKNDFDTLSQQNAVKHFRENNLNAGCFMKTCYINCGGGCRFCR